MNWPLTVLVLGLVWAAVAVAILHHMNEKDKRQPRSVNELLGGTLHHRRAKITINMEPITDWDLMPTETTREKNELLADHPVHEAG